MRGKLAAEGNEEELARRFIELELARDDFAARLDDDASYTVSTETVATRGWPSMAFARCRCRCLHQLARRDPQAL